MGIQNLASNFHTQCESQGKLGTVQEEDVTNIVNQMEENGPANDAREERGNRWNHKVPFMRALRSMLGWRTSGPWPKVGRSAGKPKVARHFFQKPSSPVMVKKAMFSGSPIEGLEVRDVEQSLVDCFPLCARCCVCHCGSTTLQIVILVIKSSSSINTRT